MRNYHLNNLPIINKRSMGIDCRVISTPIDFYRLKKLDPTKKQILISCRHLYPCGTLCGPSSLFRKFEQYEK